MLPKGVSKATALKSLTKKLGLTADQVMAIGDANNDSEMLEYAGLAIAMDNAPNHIKALASDITLSNN
ncbi:HAD-IIB family hydrolase, partial [Streptococcus suis]